MIHVDDIVWANQFGTSGLPYKAQVEEIRDDKIRIRPLRDALTMGSARTLKPGPSVRSRWVGVKSVALVKKFGESDFTA